MAALHGRHAARLHQAERRRGGRSHPDSAVLEREQGNGRLLRLRHVLDSGAGQRHVAVCDLLLGGPLVLHAKAKGLWAAHPSGARLHRGRGLPPWHPGLGRRADSYLPAGARAPGFHIQASEIGEPHLRDDSTVHRVPHHFLPEICGVHQQERLHRRVHLLDELLHRGQELLRFHSLGGWQCAGVDRLVLHLLGRGGFGHLCGGSRAHLPSPHHEREMDIRHVATLRREPVLRHGRGWGPRWKRRHVLHGDV
mmetsp:Transcript_61703/g.198817  ORF Transcript_61703/g.198817 Transcript_61703/m.198817 type:complete len:252 (+) Transcript_61703:1127-1882(+)